MTTTQQTWPQPGDEVAVITYSPGTRWPTAKKVTVERLTRTEIVIEGYSRFDRKGLEEKGRTDYGPSRKIVPIDSKEAVNTFSRAFRANKVKEIVNDLKVWAASEDLDDTQPAYVVAERLPIIAKSLSNYRESVSDG